MDRKSNSSGRGKHVSGSSGSVGKHGEGLNYGGSGSTSRGSSNNTTRATKSSSLLTSLFSSLFSGKKLTTKKKITLVIVAIVAAILIYNYCKNQQASQQESQASQVESTVDSTQDSESSYESYVEVTGEARDYYTDTKNADTVTLMIYMCGADLESSYGCATADLKEMFNATLSDNVNVIIATGGARSWKNSYVSASKNQYFKLKAGTYGNTLTELKSYTKASMTNPDTLSAFIKYCKSEFPADRYSLIFWDHGGGSVSGYGYDENFSSSGSMTLDGINTALKAGGVKFDFIGFDACLMANIETAVVCENYADYLIASEETEPGGGWYYTNWLTNLCKNPSINTVTLGQKICDDFYSHEGGNGDVSLSVIDLAEFSGEPLAAFTNFSSYLTSQLASSNYKTISSARSSTKEFAASSKINQIDLLHFAKRLGSTNATNFVSSFKSCIKYNKTSISNAYGLSVYFPYTSTAYVSKVLTIYDKIDMPESYSTCVRNFASILTGGQISSTSTGSSSSSLTGDITSTTSTSSSSITDLLTDFLGATSSSSSAISTIVESLGGSSSSGSTLGSLFNLFTSSSSSSSSSYGSIISSLFGSDSNSTSSSLTSVGSDLIASLFGTSKSSLNRQVMYDSVDLYAKNLLSPSDMLATKKGSEYVLQLTDEQWDNVKDVMLNMFVKDADGGFIDLGWDAFYEFDEDLDLRLTLDELTWLAINDQFIAAYCYDMLYASDESLSEIYYRVPCLIVSAEDGTTRKADLLLKSTKANDWYFEVFDVVFSYDGTITFAKTEDENEEIGSKLSENDQIYFIADYYTADGSFENQYVISASPIIVGADLYDSLVVTDKPIESSYGVFTNYRITDYFNNAYWTQTLKNNKTLVK